MIDVEISGSMGLHMVQVNSDAARRFMSENVDTEETNPYPVEGGSRIADIAREMLRVGLRVHINGNRAYIGDAEAVCVYPGIDVDKCNALVENHLSLLMRKLKHGESDAIAELRKLLMIGNEMPYSDLSADEVDEEYDRLIVPALVDAYEEAEDARITHMYYCPDQQERGDCEDCRITHEEAYRAKRNMDGEAKAVELYKSEERVAARRLRSRERERYYNETHGNEEDY